MARNKVDWAVDDFEQSLVKFKDKIIKNAHGKICGNCINNIRGLCIEHGVGIFFDDAVACSSHETKENTNETFRQISASSV